MTNSSPINVMISSRVYTEIKKDDGSKCRLKELRQDIKELIESVQIFNKQIFNVWISEEPSDVNATENSWDTCMRQVKRCNLFLCIYTGEAGWAKNGGDIGICHAELESAVNYEPGKVVMINIEKLVAKELKTEDDEKKRNERFIDYVKKINLMRHGKPKNYQEALNKVQDALRDALVQLVHLGNRESSRGKYNSGIALHWSRMSFQQRKNEIENVSSNYLIDNGGENIGNKLIQFPQLSLSQPEVGVGFLCHCVPDSMSTSAARELVGQPFLRDHEYAHIMQNHECSGPIHLIGVYKNVTESQAKNLLGFPDALIIKAPFGIYIADNVQKIQMVFLANCRDESSTRHNLTRFFDWINETGENDFIVARASSRKRIVDAINQEKEDDK
jgi:hypothetical protein